MAARLGNTANSRNQSMTEELFELIWSEEYVEEIVMFEGTEYVNKLELSSLKKMISGKLWIDGRKFVSRQNNSITSGLFNLFGQTMGKSAVDVRKEASDFLLSSENKYLRDIFRSSFKTAKKDYSNWISTFNNESTPCNEFGLYLLCCTYKRHVVVALSSKLWCSFKTGSMTTFEKLQKADHVLVWTGEDKFAEIKPLQLKSGIGNTLEWQHCAESLDHIHEKRLTARKVQRRPNKAMDTVKVKVKPQDIADSPTRTRRGTKRNSKQEINYAQYHSKGVRNYKSPKLDKPLPHASGPSYSRQAAQRMIVHQKNTSPRPTNSKQAGKLAVKSELIETTSNSKKPVVVKPEPGIYMRHRHNKNDANKTWRYVHASGRLCPSGESGTCSHRSNMELPDLPSPPKTSSLTLNPRENNENNEKGAVANPNRELPLETTTEVIDIEDGINLNRSVITPEPSPKSMLISPPAIERQSAMIQSKPTPKPKRDLNDLLCTLNFDQFRSVVTEKGDNRKLNELIDNTHKDKILTRTVTLQEITPVVDDDNLPDLVLPPHNSVLTDDTLNTVVSDIPKQASSVTTIRPNSGNNGPPSMDITDSIDVNQTPSRIITEQGSQTSTTPRSVLTDPDAEELETAGALLQLGSPNLRDIDKSVNNEIIMPVNRTRMEDFAKDMTETENREQGDNHSDDQDSDKTVEYPQDNEEPTTPKGTVRYKHYGIKRHSPQCKYYLSQNEMSSM